MGYRINEKPRPKPNRTVHDAVTPVRAYVHNGQIANLAFPLWYQEVHWPTRARRHDWHKHDYEGWPAPDHPDHVCQMPHGMHRLDCPPHRGKHNHCHHVKHLLRMDGLFPIRLIEEGYDSVSIEWVEEHAGIAAIGYIDEDEDWIVRVPVDAQDVNAIDEPQTYHFTVYAHAPEKPVTGKKYDKKRHELVEVEKVIPAKRDIVALVELVVLPSAVPIPVDPDDEGGQDA